MNLQRLHYRNHNNSKSFSLVKAQNDLQIDRIEYFNDKQRGMLVLLMKSNLQLEQEVNAFLEGDKLIIEAARSLDYRKPFRSHLISKEILSGNEQEGLEVGFSEMKLNQGNHYQIVTCQLINSSLLKVILITTPATKYN